MDKISIEFDAVSLACVQQGLNLMVLNAQATLAGLQAQVQRELDAEATQVPSQ